MNAHLKVNVIYGIMIKIGGYMKVIEKIKKVLLGIVIVVFSCFAIFMTILLLNYNDYGVTEFGDTSLIIIKREISSER